MNINSNKSNPDWSPSSWKTLKISQQPNYPTQEKVESIQKKV